LWLVVEGPHGIKQSRKIVPENEEALLRYAMYLKATGKSLPRQCKLLMTLKKLAIFPSSETEKGTDAEPIRITGKPYVCSHCGAEMVPQRAETPSGTSNRCPEANRFMKPLIKEEVSKREGEERDPRPLRRGS